MPGVAEPARAGIAACQLAHPVAELAEPAAPDGAPDGARVAELAEPVAEPVAELAEPAAELQSL